MSEENFYKKMGKREKVFFSQLNEDFMEHYHSLTKTHTNVKSRVFYATSYFIQQGRIDVLENLVEHGLELSKIVKKLLYVALASQQIEIAQYIIKESKININQMGNLFPKIAEIGRAKSVDFLCKNSVYLNMQGSYAMKLAIEKGHFDVVKTMVDNGFTAKENYSLLYAAINQGDKNIVELLINQDLKDDPLVVKTNKFLQVIGGFYDAVIAKIKTKLFGMNDPRYNPRKAFYDQAFRTSLAKGNYEVVDFLIGVGVDSKSALKDTSTYKDNLQEQFDRYVNLKGLYTKLDKNLSAKDEPKASKVENIEQKPVDLFSEESIEIALAPEKSAVKTVRSGRNKI